MPCAARSCSVAVAACLVLVVGTTTSCTGSEQASSRPDASESDTGSATQSGKSTTQSPTTTKPISPTRSTRGQATRQSNNRAQPSLGAKPDVPRTRVTRVAGRWPGDKSGPRTTRLERGVGRVVHRWLDEAFVSPRYPTKRFAGSFESFTPGARKDARSQLWLTTNATLGPTLVDAVPLRRQLLVSALAPAGRAVGATAKVDLMLRTLRKSGRRTQLRLTGSLSLARLDGAWRIFGYDLQRSLRRTGDKNKGDR
ncbi:hypothetical protein BH20ACT6_BH20ACT6_12640 [soil metagenome]